MDFWWVTYGINPEVSYIVLILITFYFAFFSKNHTMMPTNCTVVKFFLSFFKIQKVILL